MIRCGDDGVIAANGEEIVPVGGELFGAVSGLPGGAL